MAKKSKKSKTSKLATKQAKAATKAAAKSAKQAGKRTITQQLSQEQLEAVTGATTKAAKKQAKQEQKAAKKAAPKAAKSAKLDTQQAKAAAKLAAKNVKQVAKGKTPTASPKAAKQAAKIEAKLLKNAPKVEKEAFKQRQKEYKAEAKVAKKAAKVEKKALKQGAKERALEEGGYPGGYTPPARGAPGYTPTPEEVADYKLARDRGDLGTTDAPPWAAPPVPGQLQTGYYTPPPVAPVETYSKAGERTTALPPAYTPTPAGFLPTGAYDPGLFGTPSYRPGMEAYGEEHLPDRAQDIISAQSYFNAPQLQQTYGAAGELLERGPYAGETFAGPSAAQQQAFGNLYEAGGPRWAEAASEGYTGDVLGGGYLGAGAQDPSRDPFLRAGAPGVQQLRQTASGAAMNPYLDALYGNAAQSAARAYQTITMPQLETRYASSGRLGSGQYEQAVGSAQRGLAGELAGMATDIYGQGYESERGRQMGAAGQLAGMAQQGYTGVQAIEADRLARERAIMEGAAGRAPLYGDIARTGAAAQIQAGGLEQAQRQAELEDEYRRYQEPWAEVGKYQQAVGPALGYQQRTWGVTPKDGGTAKGGGMLGGLF